MKLINTDGMSFIGPGSEWFWTAVSGLVLAVTFIAIYRQLRTQHIQIGENAKMLRSQAHFNALSLAQRPWEVLIENAGLAGVVTHRLRNAGSAEQGRLAPMQQLHVHAVQFVGIHLLPASRRFHPEGALDWLRFDFQGTYRHETRIRPVLVRVRGFVRRTI